ncbi:hypothetical protein [Thermococcus sp. GR6]|uniref:hypothetical protein n=1 Tax=Thermococcus sp. GR6 TaxID=1638256 RepID=UPI0014307305|nr:hypothetical protein [Thermococcus sp. GR6]NJE41870.1 hypothetical protein [Thermococcus sp. GR6]
MNIKEAVAKIFPEIPELDDVDFSQYATPYAALLTEFEKSDGKGLLEFQRFIKENGGEKAVVGRFIISLLQYLLIRYRRYGEREVIIPSVKIFITLKGWLIENGYERDWLNLFHNFLGYLVDMMPHIAESEDCDMANAYLTLIHSLTLEAKETFPEEYFQELAATAAKHLRDLREKCSIETPVPEKKRKNPC